MGKCGQKHKKISHSCSDHVVEKKLSKQTRGSPEFVVHYSPGYKL